MATVPLVRSSQDISKHWLGQALGTEVESFSLEPIGAGQMGRSFRVAYTTATDDTPSSVVVKISSDDPGSRATGTGTQAYRREIEFYRTLGSRMPPCVPRCHVAEIDDDGEWFTLVLEDVMEGELADQITGCDSQQAASALRSLADIQGPLLGDHVLGATPWLNLPWPLTQDLFQHVLPGFVERFGSTLTSEQLELCTWFAERVDDWLADRRPPLGIVHGDFRLDNLLETPNGTSVIDWQSATWGPPMRDAAFLLGGNMNPAERRRDERQLLRAYVDRLNAAGNATLPWDEAWTDYRLQSLYGVLMLVVASMVVEETERGNSMFAALIGRHAQHALDLDVRTLAESTGVGPMRPRPEDERLHAPAAGEHWSESYYFDAVSSDGQTAVYVRTGRLHNQSRVLYTASIVRRGKPTIMIVDESATLPSPDDSDHRIETPDFVATQRCVDPLWSYTVTLEGRGRAFDDHATPLRRETGQPADVRLDLAWASDGIPYRWRQTPRYEIPCHVTGTITIDGEEITFDGPGQRDHSWGNRDWWEVGWMWSALHLDDGMRVHAVAVTGYPQYAVGYTQRDGSIVELTGVSSSPTVDEDGLVHRDRLSLQPGGLDLEVTTVGSGPLLLTSSTGQVTHFVRAWCDVEAADGRRGTGWIEWNLIQAP